MSELNPCDCGKKVRIRAMRISLNRKQGVTHWLEHDDFTPVCVSGEWSAAMFKPYPKNEADKPKAAMFAKWNNRAIKKPVDHDSQRV